MKFRNKPVTIDAFQYLGPESLDKMPPVFREALVREKNRLHIPAYSIATLDGLKRVHVGDWIVRSARGDFYPSRPSLFLTQWEPEADT